MPKENINDIVIDGFRAELHWSADSGYVQIGTVNTASTLTLPTDDSPAPTGRPPAAAVENPPPGSDQKPFYGWYVTLDRDGINRLVRHLRRARDQAFGADA